MAHDFAWGELDPPLYIASPVGLPRALVNWAEAVVEKRRELRKVQYIELYKPVLPHIGHFEAEPLQVPPSIGVRAHIQVVFIRVHH